MSKDEPVVEEGQGMVVVVEESSKFVRMEPSAECIQANGQLDPTLFSECLLFLRILKAF